MRYLQRVGALLLLGLLVLPALGQKDPRPDPSRDVDENVPKTPAVNPSRDIDPKVPKTPAVNPSRDVDPTVPKTPAPTPSKDIDKKAGKTQPKGPGPKPRKDLDKDVNTEKTVRAGQLVGKVLGVIESTKSLRLQVTVPYVSLNEGEANAVVQAQQNYLQAAAKRPPDVDGMRNALIDMQRHQANIYKVEQKTQDLEVKTGDEVKVRTIREPEVFDEKGKLKRLSAKERKELKGDDPRLPGYKAEFSDLREGQIVQVNLVRKRGALPRPAGGRRGKDIDPDLLADFQPHAEVVVILADPPSQ